MINLKIPTRIIKEAKRQADEMGALKNSIRSGGGNLGAFVAEMCVAEYLGAERKNTYNYDLVLDGLTIDVKNKKTSKEPKPYYECSVADFNLRQGCDMYLFTRTRGMTRDLWILGWVSKDDFMELSVPHKKGEYDQSNGFTFKADCHNMRIDQLGPLAQQVRAGNS